MLETAQSNEICCTGYEIQNILIIYTFLRIVERNTQTKIYVMV